MCLVVYPCFVKTPHRREWVNSEARYFAKLIEENAVNQIRSDFLGETNLMQDLGCIE